MMANIAEVNKVSNFFEDNKDLFMENEKALISGSIIGNYHDQTEAYVKQTPLFEETYDNDRYHIKISLYPFVQFKNDQAINALALVITDLEINDDNALLIDDDKHILKASITFDRAITLNDTEVVNVTEIFTNTYENHTKLLVIQQDKINTPSGYAEYEQIIISYQLKSNLNQEMVMLVNSEISDQTPADLFDESYDRDIKNVLSTNIDLLSIYGLDQFKDQLEIYYNEYLLKSLQSYNSLYFRYMSIGVIIVSIATYFIFFHKYVLRKLRDKKANKQKAYEAIKEALLKEKNNK
jgi:hypothetical protein